MPGIAGVVDRRGGHASAAAGLAAMRHFRRYVAREVRIQSGIAVGAALAFRAMVGRDWLSEASAMRLAGSGLAIVAAVALATAAWAG